VKKKTGKITQADLGAQDPNWKHPDDIAAEAESVRFAADVIDKWFAARLDKFKALVSTYPDGEAEELLVYLREDFWADRELSNTWLAKQGKAAP